MKKKLEKNRYSVSKILREKNRSNDFFEIMLGNLTLEEIISLKLEIAFRSGGVPIYGLPIWKNTPKIAREAVLRYALLAGGSKKNAALLLGMNDRQLSNYLSKYDILTYYKEKGDGIN